jgi:xanthine dehydrogenase accessory factor
MRELTQIVDAFAQLTAAGQTAALATVTAVEGSSYRRPGAQMLVAADGRTWGTISGGCLERDVARRARLAIHTGQCDVCCYETADGDDDPLSPGEPATSLGCGGRIDILIEPVSPQRPGPLAALTRVVRHRQTATIATIVRADAAALPHLAQRIICLNTVCHSDISDSDLRSLIMHDQLFSTKPNTIRQYQTATGGCADVLFERLSPPQSLIIFGDGADAQPLVEFAKTLGWHVSVIGSRPVANLRQRFSSADIVTFADFENPTVPMAIEANAAAVVMGHHLRRDVAALRQLLKSPPRYIGILGPRHRTRRLLAQAGATTISDELRRRLYWPIGLDIGAHTSEQIALSIVAEIQTAIAHRGGASLRDRGGTIHADPPLIREKVAQPWRM